MFANGRVLAFVIRSFHAFRKYGRPFRLMLGKSAVAAALLDVMRIMAFGTDEPAFLAGAGPFAYALAMDTVAPIAKNIAVAFAAQDLRLIVTDRIAEVIDQLVALGAIVTIKTPAIIFGMMQFDVGMLVLEFSFFCIDLQPRMTVAAGKYPLR